MQQKKILYIVLPSILHNILNYEFGAHFRISELFIFRMTNK